MGKIFNAAQQLFFGGCRHRKMGWPIWVEGYTYRVCLECGIKRLFDEETLQGYGPYGYHVKELLARGSEAKAVIARMADSHISARF